MRPLLDRVVVAPDIPPTEKNGLLLPGTAVDNIPVSGIVVSVGPGRYLENGELLKTEVKAGEKVLYKSGCGTEIEGLIIMRESDILAVIEKGGSDV